MKPKTLYAQCLNPGQTRPRYAVYQMVKGKLEVLWPVISLDKPQERNLMPGQVYYTPRGLRRFPAFHFRPEAGASSYVYQLAVNLADHFLREVEVIVLAGWSCYNRGTLACHECPVCLTACVGKPHHAKCRPAAKRMGVKL